MQRVIHTIQDNLPSHLSIAHWHVGPMEGDFPVNNDLRPSELRATGDYNLMQQDNDVALATAAAAAAMAMEHNNKQRPRRSQERLRALAAGLPQQRERVAASIQGIRERTPAMIQGIKERTPELLQEIREQANKKIQRIRHYVLSTEDYPPDCDFDATGRRISNTADYNNSLNEEEQREQPPPFARLPRMHCNQAWKKLYPKTTADAAEYYVNFEDGNTQEAVNGALATATSRPEKSVAATTDYTNMNDPLDIKRHPPTKKAEEKERGPAHSTRTQWGAAIHKQAEEQKEVSACEEKQAQSDGSTSVHSTAKYQWGAAAPSVAEANQRGAASSAAEARAAARKSSAEASSPPVNEIANEELSEKAASTLNDVEAANEEPSEKTESSEGNEIHEQSPVEVSTPLIDLVSPGNEGDDKDVSSFENEEASLAKNEENLIDLGSPENEVDGTRPQQDEQSLEEEEESASEKTMDASTTEADGVVTIELMADTMVEANREDPEAVLCKEQEETTDSETSVSDAALDFDT